MARHKTKTDAVSWGPGLQAGRFVEVCSALEKLAAKNRQQIYVLGYAYWRLNQPYKAMAQWWRLAHTYESTLLEDLEALSGYVQRDHSATQPDWKTYSLAELKSLFLCLRRLAAEAPVTYALRNHLYQKLWLHGSFAELKMFTQSDPGLTPNEKMIWLAKLQWRFGRHARELSASFVEGYAAAVETFLRENNGKLDAATLSCYVLELQSWLMEHPAGLEAAQIAAFVRLAQLSFSITGADVPRAPFIPVHSRPDPFAVLGVNPESSKAEIMAAMMKRIREEPQNMAGLRRAQSEIFDPERLLRVLFFHHPLPARMKKDAGVHDLLPLNAYTLVLPYRGPKEFAPDA